MNQHQSTALFAILVFVLPLASGCATTNDTNVGPLKKATVETAPKVSAPHAPMHEVLAELADNADPAQNYHLNSQKQNCS